MVYAVLESLPLFGENHVHNDVGEIATLGME